MKEKPIASKEIMIAKNGKPLFAVRIDNGEGNEASYVYVESGDIKFSSSWMSNIAPFTLGNESHRIAKEIFTEGMRTAIKVKILELKQLESIFYDLNLGDCLGNILVDNTRLLLEVKNSVESMGGKIEEVDKKTLTEKNIRDITADVVVEKSIKPDDIKAAAESAIVDCVNPVAIKKPKRKPKSE